MILVVNYGVGNLKSIKKALGLFTEKVEVTLSAEKIENANGIVLPGVGAFSTAMENLRKFGLDKMLAETDSPVLGICLGMQLFAKSSEEGNCKGLGIINETVKRLPRNNHKVPHMGWNVVKIRKNSEILKGIEKNFYAYFVHSYYMKSKHEIASTNYTVEFSSVIEKDNYYGFQFHPEKSGKVGLKIIGNFVRLCGK